ncbi:hypothetical protein HOLleu_16332 [Holothuria leucospilota]|uniref:Uncharacterized protein n=1 Tax=Holothuria leucospilota TaxID=206669 RepID=A0A9Q1C5H5_HOLLE|nr:hypothetical protein HOLleu_16332 [Holothuria leucospilota]
MHHDVIRWCQTLVVLAQDGAGTSPSLQRKKYLLTEYLIKVERARDTLPPLV